MLIVIPWQYVVANVSAYNRNLNAVYLAEKLALLVGLAACWIGGKGRWRNLYASLFGMSFSYAASSALANWAIDHNVYYSGSFYDIPLACAMAWPTWVGLRTRVEEPEADAREVSTVFGVWVARLSMIAAFSLPLFAAWAITEADCSSSHPLVPAHADLAAALLMGLMVFVRQQLLDRELMHLLDHSRDSVDNLNRLQAQILQSEKLASIGQLVGGAAHELNNPITAMLGYSDLLLSTRLTPEQQPLAVTIGQYVRRTRSLVASLISFARQAPSPKTLIDLNTLARTALKLTQPQWEAAKVEVRTQFDAQLPRVLGDSNQLIQVCLQLVGNCVHAMATRGGRVLTVTTKRQAGVSVLRIATEPMPLQPTVGSDTVSTLDPEDSLGLSACQGILQEHCGKILRQRREDGALLLSVELPAIEPTPAAKTKEPTVPVLWQSQPSA